MANINRFGVNQALNTLAAGAWTVKTPSSASATTEVAWTVADDTMIIGIDTNTDLYYTWDSSTGTSSCSPTNDLRFKANSSGEFMRVPRGIRTPTFHFLATSGTGKVRRVEI